MSKRVGEQRLHRAKLQPVLFWKSYKKNQASIKYRFLIAKVCPNPECSKALMLSDLHKGFSSVAKDWRCECVHCGYPFCVPFYVASGLYGCQPHDMSMRFCSFYIGELQLVEAIVQFIVHTTACSSLPYELNLEMLYLGAPYLYYNCVIRSGAPMLAQIERSSDVDYKWFTRIMNNFFISHFQTFKLSFLNSHRSSWFTQQLRHYSQQHSTLKEPPLVLLTNVDSSLFNIFDVTGPPLQDVFAAFDREEVWLDSDCEASREDSLGQQLQDSVQLEQKLDKGMQAAQQLKASCIPIIMELKSNTNKLMEKLGLGENGGIPDQ